MFQVEIFMACYIKNRLEIQSVLTSHPPPSLLQPIMVMIMTIIMMIIIIIASTGTSQLTEQINNLISFEAIQDQSSTFF